MPGLLGIALYAGLVQWIAIRDPQHLPRGQAHSWRERFASLKDLWAVLLLFFFVIGVIYGGLFTVQEASGVGAAGTLLIGVVRGRLGWRQVRAALVDSLRVSSAIMMIVVGAFLFGYFLTITQFTQNAVEWWCTCRSAPTACWRS